MEPEREELEQLLIENGFSLARTKKHRIWKNASGKIWVTPATASDHHAFKNNLEQFHRFLTHGVAKCGTVPLTVSETERTRAEAVLHPTAPRRVREPKARRVVSKRVPARPPLAETPLPAKPRPSSPATPDLYKIGRTLEAALSVRFEEVFYRHINNLVTEAKSECETRSTEMKAEGATYEQVRYYRARKRSATLQFARTTADAVTLALRNVVRIFQRAVRLKQTKESHGAEILVAVNQGFRRRLGDRALLGPLCALICKECWRVLGEEIPAGYSTLLTAAVERPSCSLEDGESDSHPSEIAGETASGKL